MTKLSSSNDVFNKLLSLDNTLKLTDLRKEVLKIFIDSKKPVSAYDALNQLKKKRDSAEPPTVYRVIEYFVKKKVIHRVESENKYVFCTQLDNFKSDYHGIIFICQTCLASFEVRNKAFASLLNSLSHTHHFLINSNLIEIKGICDKCKKK